VNGPTWPAISSVQANALADDWRVFTVGALALAILVWGLILYAAVRFRRTEANAAPRSQKDQNVPLEIGWTIAPLIAIIILFGATAHIETSVEARSAAHAVQVMVTGYRWGWRFAYRGGPTLDGTPARPPELVLPLGENAALDVTSTDVVHSFWIPDMLFKRDAIPGRVTGFDITPTKLGTFRGECGEFCGLNHALMTFSVRVVSPADYRRWLAHESTQ
jgi:cytochrome c oxidase subunit II